MQGMLRTHTLHYHQYLTHLLVPRDTKKFAIARQAPVSAETPAPINNSDSNEAPQSYSNGIASRAAIPPSVASDATQQPTVPGSMMQAAMWCCVMSYYRLILFSTASEAQLRPPIPWLDQSVLYHSPTSCKSLEIPLASMDCVEKTVYQAG